MRIAVERADGTAAVLKINAPDRESEHEADALALWGGVGAARLLASEPSERALLLERCVPGTPLWHIEDDDEATRIAASMLRRIWRTPPSRHPFALVVDEARRWAEELPIAFEQLGHPFERRLLDAAVGACGELIVEPGPLGRRPSGPARRKHSPRRARAVARH